MAERKTRAAEQAEAAETPVKAAEAPVKTTSPAASPLEGPQPKKPELKDPPIMPSSSIAPHAPYSDQGTRLLGESGDELTLADFLAFPEDDAPRHEAEHPQIMAKDYQRLVTVTQRVYREYTPLGARTKVTQLLYTPGARITKGEAERLSTEAMPPPRGAGAWTGGPVGQNDPS